MMYIRQGKVQENRDISFATGKIVATRAFQNGRGIVSSARALVETPGKLDETAAPMHQARWSKHQGQASNRTPVQEIREAIVQHDIIALEYMSTKADEFVQNAT